VFKTSEFRTLPAADVEAIVKRNGLNISEIDIFEAIVDWAKAELKKSDTAESPEASRKVLADILPHVRFPIMSTQDIAVKVNPSKILEPQQVLDLFTYLGLVNSGNSSARPGKSLEVFKTTKRKPRKPPAFFKWDATKKHAGLTVSSDGRTVTSSSSGYHGAVFGDAELTDGVHEWELVLTVHNSNAYALNIGVTPTSFSNWGVAQMIGYSGHIPGWAFATGNGQKFHNSTEHYSRRCNQGDVIKVRLDLEAKTLEFFINGASQGIAFRDVIGPVRPSMSMFQYATATLQFPKSA